MANTVLYDDGVHRNILLEDFDTGNLAVQANQHLIIHAGSGMILDPGGHKVYSKVMAETFSILGGAKLTHLFLSHQDPDIVAAVNGWLMSTDATAYISALWTREPGVSSWARSCFASSLKRCFGSWRPARSSRSSW